MLNERPLLRLACALRSPDEVRTLRAWMAEHLPAAQLDELCDPRELGTLYGSAAARAQNALHELLVIDERCALQPEVLGGIVCGPATPDLVLLGLSPLAAFRLRARGFAVAAELQHPLCEQELGDVLRHCVQVRMPLKQISRRLAGVVSLRDALSFVRFYMLQEALARTPSKRGAARTLGITRPAVQSMSKSLLGPGPLSCKRPPRARITREDHGSLEATFPTLALSESAQVGSPASFKASR
jgi:hypothetical protein